MLRNYYGVVLSRVTRLSFKDKEVYDPDLVPQLSEHSLHSMIPMWWVALYSSLVVCPFSFVFRHALAFTLFRVAQVPIVNSDPGAVHHLSLFAV